MADIITVEVLEDGSLKISTDKVSAPNHTNADGMIKALVADAGGVVTRARKGTMETHVHVHDGKEHTH